jgi:hypothetical protein
MGLSIISLALTAHFARIFSASQMRFPLSLLIHGISEMSQVSRDKKKTQVRGKTWHGNVQANSSRSIARC